jgi:pSer/pThr/pTyr-binding forkhead associated (FHA) protein
MSIGRAKDNDIVVENLSVSRNHARIRFHNGKYVLTDLNSANGTFVNGQRQTKVELAHNDLIQIGKHTLVFINQKMTEQQLNPEQPGQPILQVTNGKLAGTQYLITKFETKIGKGVDCDLILTDDWLMPQVLALILRRGDEVYEIHDRGKLVRTKVNGENVDQPRILKYGDRVEFGSTVCIFERATDVPAGSGSGVRGKVDLGNYDSVFGKPGDSGANPPTKGAAPPKPSTGFGRQPTELPEEDIRGPESAEVKSAQAEAIPEQVLPRESSANAQADPCTSYEAPPLPAAGEPTAAAPADSQNLGLSPVMAALAAAGNPAHRTPAVDDGSATGRQAKASSSAEMPAVGSWRTKEFPPLPEGVDPKEVAMWEAMLDNKSPAVRKQALRQLKKLTDRDYDI